MSLAKPVGQDGARWEPLPGLCGSLTYYDLEYKHQLLVSPAQIYKLGRGNNLERNEFRICGDERTLIGD